MISKFRIAVKCLSSSTIHFTEAFLRRDFGSGRKIRDQLSPKFLFLVQACETTASFVKSSINCGISALDQYANLTPFQIKCPMYHSILKQLVFL